MPADSYSCLVLKQNNNFTSMYLKRLFNANKWWFVLIVLFIIVQLVMDVKQGISISPIYHYGMYSAVILPQKEYMVTEINVNGKKLQTKNFTPYQWDRITLPVDLFNRQQSWNTQVFNTEIKRLLHFTDSSKYVDTLTGQQFNSWYKNYLSEMLRIKIDSLSINTVPYIFDGNNLTAQTKQLF